MSSCVVPGDDRLVTHSTVIWIVPSISFTVYPLVVPGYEFPFTQCSRIQICVSMTLNMTLYVATGDGSFATQSTEIWIFPSRNLYEAICLVCGVVCGCAYPNLFLWLGILRLFSTLAMLHCLLPSSYISFSFSFFFFLNPDCNDLIAKINKVLSKTSDVHIMTVLHPHMLCQPLFRQVCAVALTTINLLEINVRLGSFGNFTFDNNS